MLKFTATLLLTAVAALPAFAEGFSLKVEEKSPPEELSDDIKKDIIGTSYQISDANGVFFEFWFVGQVTLSAFADTTKKTMENMEQIGLIGAAIVYENDEDYTDFREDPIDPGLFVMRLSLQPQDGNHMGTSPFDTFAILIPHERDAEVLKFMDPEEMVDIASEDTPAEHPPILSLQPLEESEGEFPRLEHDEEDSWNFLYLKMPAKAGDETKDISFKLVFEGIGEL